MKLHPLVAWRYQNNLTQDGAHLKLGWSTSAVAQVEQGAMRPGPKLIWRMIRNLKVSENEALRLCGITAKPGRKHGTLSRRR